MSSRLEERPIHVQGNLSTTFLNLVTAGDSCDCSSALLLLIAMIVYPVAYALFAVFYSLYGTILFVTGPLGAGSDAELWIGFVGSTIRNQRHDLLRLGLDLRHLLPPGDCDQC